MKDPELLVSDAAVVVQVLSQQAMAIIHTQAATGRVQASELQEFLANCTDTVATLAPRIPTAVAEETVEQDPTGLLAILEPLPKQDELYFLSYYVHQM